MAHFAQIKDGVVQQVIVVHNNELLVDGVEVESKGAEFCHNLFGGEWVQTSYNGTFRKQFCGKNFTYDAVNDVFIAPQPWESWVLDENFEWQPPTPKPVDGKDYFWFEPNQQWIEIVEP